MIPINVMKNIRETTLAISGGNAKLRIDGACFFGAKGLLVRQ
jgi:hypothetical protein